MNLLKRIQNYYLNQAANALAATMVATILLLLSENVLIVSVEARRVYALIAYILFALAMGKQPAGSRPVQLITWAGLLLGWWILFRTGRPLYLLLLFDGILFFHFLLYQSCFLKRLLFAAIAFTVYWAAYLGNAVLFYGLDAVSTWFSETVGGLFLINPQILGSSASGLHVLSVFVAVYLLAYRKNLLSASIFLGWLLAVWGLYQLTGKILLSGFMQISSQVILIPMAGVIFLILDPVAQEDEEAHGRLRRLMIGGAAAAAMMGLLWPGVYFSSFSESNKRVLFFDNGFFDLKTPNFSEFGALSGGLFGMLPKYLQPYGYESNTLTGDVTADALEAVDIFVVVNPQKKWRKNELEAIWTFVENGGSLLVLGDHTDIMGTQSVLNKLLEPVRIGFHFDSGFPCRSEWRYCLEPRLHPITAQLRNYHDATISVGATLSVQYPSYPVLIGKYGFADYGNRFNEQGAYLGDYTYSPGEKLGDVILVAVNEFGKGKVVVFGDTSPFQNGALFTSFTNFTHQTFQWLSQDGGRACSPVLFLAFVPLFGIFFFLFAQISGRWEIAVVLLILASVIWWSDQHLSDTLQNETRGDNILWVDLSHMENLAFFPFQRNSVGAVVQNAMRNDYLTYVMKKFDPKRLNKSAVFLSVAPARPFDKTTIQQLHTFMEKGGTVLLAAGFEDRYGAMSLLNQYDLDISAAPLGPIPIIKHRKSSSRDIQFVSAWPIVDVKDGKSRNIFKIQMDKNLIQQDSRKAGHISGGERTLVPVRKDLEVLYQHNGYATAVSKTVGKGKFIFIADSLFLGEENLETMKTYKEGNILFLRSIFDKVRSAAK